MVTQQSRQSENKYTDISMIILLQEYGRAKCQETCTNYTCEARSDLTMGKNYGDLHRHNIKVKISHQNQFNDMACDTSSVKYTLYMYTYIQKLYFLKTV